MTEWGFSITASAAFLCSLAVFPSLTVSCMGQLCFRNEFFQKESRGPCLHEQDRILRVCSLFPSLPSDFSLLNRLLWGHRRYQGSWVHWVIFGLIPSKARSSPSLPLRGVSRGCYIRSYVSSLSGVFWLSFLYLLNILVEVEKVKGIWREADRFHERKNHEEKRNFGEKSNCNSRIQTFFLGSSFQVRDMK